MPRWWKRLRLCVPREPPCSVFLLAYLYTWKVNVFLALCPKQRRQPVSCTMNRHTERNGFAGQPLHSGRHPLFIASLFPKVFLTGTGAEQESNVSSPVSINHSLLIQTHWKREPLLHSRKEAHFVFWKKNVFSSGQVLNWALSKNEWLRVVNVLIGQQQPEWAQIFWICAINYFKKKNIYT